MEEVPFKPKFIDKDSSISSIFVINVYSGFLF